MFAYEHDPNSNEHYRANDDQTWRTEQVTVNDCFLKNMNFYRYIVNFDIDEIIVPTKKTGRNWVEMMEVLENMTERRSA